ncbi:alpha/beta fold hydrolase [Prosthecomicrobium sp. N25]|uniref:alpha/beta fold hydrolase n=1 Tax=Prosthecomicrobium sp. N25 TaxID=3129254 RepID=UPI0030780A2D
MLGDLLVLRGGEVQELPPSRKTRALLAYLAVTGRPERRERLCEMFWDVPDDPRGALRWSLSKIRGIVNREGAEVLRADRNTVAFDHAALATDLARVRALAGRSADGLGTDELRAVADNFRGLFLDDLSLPRCPDFEAWRVAHVNDMELLRLGVLRRLLDRLEDDPDAALPYAHQLQRLAPEDRGVPARIASLLEAARRRSMAAPPPSRPGARDPAPAPPSAEPTLEAATPTPSAPPPEAPVAQDIRSCAAPDGTRLAYAVTGSGPPIVRAAHWLSHLEFDLESPVWRHWIQALSEETMLVRYDERGNGMSEWDVGDIDFEAMVTDLETVMDAAGLGEAVLLGVSQGCAISAAYAARHPERVRGLVLYGGYVKGWRARGEPGEIAVREAMGTLMREGWGRDDPVFRQLFTSIFVPGGSREQMDWFNDLQRRSVTPENAFRLSESFSRIDVSALLPEVRCPTLVIHARGDRVAPLESGRAFATGIPGARFVLLESDNHILLEHEPAFDRFIAEIRAFVAALPPPARASAVRQAAPAKRPVSILVADLAPVARDLDEFADPEAADLALEPIVEAGRQALHRHGAVVLDSREGVLTAAFGAERAIEDHALQACRAADDLRHAVARAAPGATAKIAIDSGEAVIRTASDGSGRREASGPVVKAATRLCALLARDAIALTARAAAAAGGAVEVRPIDPRDCPGLGADEIVHAFAAERRVLSRWRRRARHGLTPLVGRRAEFDRLARAGAEAAAGRGRAVGLVAGPGLGKSRLAEEFFAGLPAAGWTVAEAGAQELDENASHSLLKRVLLAFLGLDGSEAPDLARAAIEERIADAGADLATPLAWVIGATLDDPDWQAASGTDRARRIRDAVVRLVLLVAAERPVALLVEDLHWADPESRRAIDRLVRAVADRRVLVVTTSRPEFRPSWSDAAGYEPLPLGPLPPAESRAFLRGLLGPDESLDGLVEMIGARTEGVPLFMEETVNSLVQSRRLVGRPGALAIREPIRTLDIPASVQSVIAARLDSLDEAARSLIDIASAIGPSAPDPLLRDLSGLGPAFDGALARLRAADLLRDGTAGGEPGSAFRHALIQDATYGSLPAARRKALHGAILDAVERLYPGRAEEDVERMAFHALRAEAWGRAVRYLVAAADRAIDRSAYPAAARFLEEAVRALEHRPADRETWTLGVDIRMRMRIAYMVTGDFDRAIERLKEAQDLARDAGDPGRLAYTLLHTSYVYSTYGRVELALDAAEDARGIGLALADERLAAEADLAAAQAHMIRGEAVPSLRRLLPHAEGFQTRWADDRLGFLVTRSVWYLGSLASTRALLGDRDAALAEMALASRLAEAGRRPIDRYAAAYFESLVRIVEGPGPDFLDRLAALPAECRERAPFPFHPWLLATLGHAELAAGRPSAVATLEAAFEAAERANMPHFLTYVAALLAIANARPDDPGSREDLLDALRSARLSLDSWIEIEVLEALARLDGGEAARTWLGEALASAEISGYKPFAARIRAALASL